MPASKSANVEPSCTSKVMSVLKQYDDFLDVSSITVLTGLKKQNVLSSLWWLQKIKAVESVNSGGVPFWFATPDTDMRSRTIDERKKEDEPRKAKRSRPAIVTPPPVPALSSQADDDF